MTRDDVSCALRLASRPRVRVELRLTQPERTTGPLGPNAAPPLLWTVGSTHTGRMCFGPADDSPAFVGRKQAGALTRAVERNVDSAVRRCSELAAKPCFHDCNSTLDRTISKRGTASVSREQSVTHSASAGRPQDSTSRDYHSTFSSPGFDNSNARLVRGSAKQPWCRIGSPQPEAACSALVSRPWIGQRLRMPAVRIDQNFAPFEHPRGLKMKVRFFATARVA